MPLVEPTAAYILQWLYISLASVPLRRSAITFEVNSVAL